MFRKKASVPTLPPEVMIVGLGNPGPEYAGTRHNVGFDLVDRIAERHRIVVKTHKHRALFGIGEIAGTVVILVKPMTFMNISGQAVAPLARDFNILPERIIVVADDLDLDVGRIRWRAKGSSGGHNGHKSLIKALMTEEYPRIKIGIGKAGETIDHVLSKFKPDERAEISDMLAIAERGIETFLSNGNDAAMGWVNTHGGGKGE